MYSILLVIIYFAFISLGLPDSLLGAAWPMMAPEFDAPLSGAGILSVIISAGTILSSLFSDKLTRRFGAGKVTAVSVLLTAAALLGFSVSRSFPLLCVIALPYGLGAGAVDAALNNYVALHYSARHMSWLHCFWGVGASIGPYIMGWAIGSGHGWRGGYGTVSVIQFVLTAALFLTLPLWKHRKTADAPEEVPETPLRIRDALGMRGVKQILLAFFAYCAFESTAGLWASSYLVQYRGLSAERAASFAALFYLGITAGRFISGFVAERLGDKRLIRIGIGVMFAGILLIALPIRQPTDLSALIGLVVSGLGAAPIYPSVIHSTPEHFGKENSHAVVGIQMASAYCGTILVPPLFGLVAQYVSIWLYPFFLGGFVLLLLLMTERVNRLCRA